MLTPGVFIKPIARKINLLNQWNFEVLLILQLVLSVIQKLCGSLDTTNKFNRSCHIQPYVNTKSQSRNNGLMLDIVPTNQVPAILDSKAWFILRRLLMPTHQRLNNSTPTHAPLVHTQYATRRHRTRSNEFLVAY